MGVFLDDKPIAGYKPKGKFLDEPVDKTIRNTSDLVSSDSSESTFFDRAKVFMSEVGLGFTRGGTGLMEASGQNMNFIGRVLRVNKDNIDRLSKVGAISPIKAKLATAMSDKLVDFGGEVVKHWQGERAFLDKFKDKDTWEGSFTENMNFTRVCSSVAESIPAMAVGLAAGGATGSTWAGASVLGTIEGLGVFQEGVDKGKSDTRAITSGVVAGGFSAGLEYYFGALDNILNPDAKRYLARFSLNMLEEGIQEGVQQITTNVVRRVGIDKTVDIFEGLVEAMIVGGLTGGLMTSPTSKKGSRSKFEQAFNELEATEQDTLIEVTGEVLKANADVIDQALTENVKINNQAIDKELQRKAQEAYDEKKPKVVEGTEAVPIEEDIKQAMEKEKPTSIIEVDDILDKALKKQIEQFEQIEGSRLDKVGRIKAEITANKATIEAIKAEPEYSEMGEHIFPDKQPIIKELRENIKFKQDRLKFFAEPTSKKKDTQLLKEKIKNFKRGFRSGERIARQDIKEFQNQIVDTIKALPIEAKDKAKFLSSIKQANTFDKAIEVYEDIQRRAEVYEAQNKKTDIDDKIQRELKYTKPVKQGVKRVGKYDYESNKFFEKIRDYSKLNQKDAFSELLSLSDPQSEAERIQRRFLEYKINGKSKGSVELFQAVLGDNALK